jgi:CheY-like chemotaxis protein
LESSGHRVTCCDGGRTALAATQRSAFDVILIDINMPGMTGVETVKRIRAQRSHANCSIIALTAHATDEERDRYRAAGMDDIIIKPLRRGAVESLMANIATKRMAPAPDMDPSGVLIEQDRLQALADALPRSKVRELLQQAGRSMLETATALRKAWHNEDRVSVAQCTHRLAGVAGNFGCAGLASLAYQIESDCKSGGIGQNFVQAFEEMFQATLTALQREWEDE